MARDMILKKREDRLSQKTNSGNILFLILIAVALFAALSYTVTQMGRTPGSTIENEKAKLSQAEIDSYTAQLNQGKSRLELINNCKNIDYTPPADQVAGDKSCHMFHPDGAGVAHRSFSDTCPDDNLLSGLNNIGDRCGLVVYAGVFGGSRLYVAAGDQGPYSWNNGSADWTVTSANSLNDGQANTNTLVALSDIGAPYNAANACRALGNAWYLPAWDELSYLYSNRSSIGGFIGGSGDRLWSSSEFSNFESKNIRLSDGAFRHTPKNAAHNVRCVRR
jgi:hypothetical protein